MPPPGIIDTHVHFADTEAFPLPAYAWHACSEHLAARLMPDVFAEETKECGLVGTVFVESHHGLWEGRREETAWACGMVDRGVAHLCGAVVAAPIGDVPLGDLQRHLDDVAAHPAVKGVRNNIQGREAGFGSSRGYIDACREVGKRGLAVDICIKAPQLLEVVDLCTAAPATTFVLNHVGKPTITTDGAVDPVWQAGIHALSRLPNVHCKLSGLLTEVVGFAWTPQLLAPYIAGAIAAFGWHRVLYGSDWYAMKIADNASYPTWLECLQRDATVAGATEAQRAALFHDNAVRVYKLPVGGGRVSG